jgi:TPR repeat protein
MTRVISCLLLLCSLAPGAWAVDAPGDFGVGLTAYKKGDFAGALAQWRPLAEQGNAAARHNLGVMYAEGRGVARDDAQAVHWFRLAAEQGDAQARLSLANMYYAGRGVARNLEQAAALYRQAAEQGLAVAQQNLANMYYQGQGVAQDEMAAGKWYRKAAEQGQPLAQYNVGILYAIGKAGMARDNPQAYLWLTLAADKGVAPAEAALENLTAKMSPEELAQAKALVHARQGQHPSASGSGQEAGGGQPSTP